MNIQEKLNFILNNYPSNKQEKKNKSFKGNEIVANLNKGLPEFVDYTYNGRTFTSNGSAGQGGWATVPWLGIFVKTISETAQAGFDIVYLFKEDMSTVYLSLNQGWSFFKKQYKTKKEAEDNIKRVSRYWQKSLSYDEHVSREKISLWASDRKDANTDLPDGYELGNILSIKYDKDNIPDNQKLEVDLKYMMDLLCQLQSEMLDTSNIQATINYILESEDISSLKNNQIEEKVDAQNDYLKLEDAPSKKIPEYNFTGKVSKTDIEHAQSKRKKLGSSGEELVLQYEKNKLLKAGKTHLAYKVSQSSKTQGDGLGYDIKSYDINGKKIYIEVKSTTHGKNTPFYISRNEIAASKKFSKNFKLYRVFGLGIKQVPGFYIVEGDLSRQLNLEATDFEALPKSKKS